MDGAARSQACVVRCLAERKKLARAFGHQPAECNIDSGPFLFCLACGARGCRHEKGLLRICPGKPLSREAARHRKLLLAETDPLKRGAVVFKSAVPRIWKLDSQQAVVETRPATEPLRTDAGQPSQPSRSPQPIRPAGPAPEPPPLSTERFARNDINDSEEGCSSALDLENRRPLAREAGTPADSVENANGEPSNVRRDEGDESASRVGPTTLDAATRTVLPPIPATQSVELRKATLLARIKAKEKRGPENISDFAGGVGVVNPAAALPGAVPT